MIRPLRCRGPDLIDEHRCGPILWLAVIALVVVLGLGSRRLGHRLPSLVATYIGNTLWATAAFLGIGLILRGASTRRIAVLALVFSLMIEVSHLYHAPWIDAIRQTNLRGLALGFGFVWNDLACNAVDVGLGVIVEGASRSSREGRETHSPCQRSTETARSFDDNPFRCLVAHPTTRCKKDSRTTRAVERAIGQYPLTGDPGRRGRTSESAVSQSEIHVGHTVAGWKLSPPGRCQFCPQTSFGT